MNNDILRPLIGHQVEVRSQFGDGELKDTGILEAYNSRWISIKKNTGEKLFFPIVNVRLLKTLN